MPNTIGRSLRTAYTKSGEELRDRSYDIQRSGKTKDDDESP